MVCINEQSFRIEAGSLYWGRGEKFCVSDITTASLGGKYFTFASPDTRYYVWFDTGMDADPMIAGHTGIEVTITGSETVAGLVTLITTAVNAVPKLYATKNSTSFCIEFDVPGEVIATATDGLMALATGWDFEVCIEGVGMDLGDTEGGIEITIENSEIEILTDANGAIPADIFKSGTNATVACSLLEMTQDRWRLLIAKALGDSYTPSMGTEVIGFGESKNFKSLYAIAGKLVIHPINEATRDRDITLWKAVPLPESYNFSGTESSKLAISFRALVDKTIRSEVNVLAYGDHEQDLRA